MEKLNTTEAPSGYENLDTLPVADILKGINREDRLVPEAIEKELPSLEKLVNLVVEKLSSGGRLFYIGAGTSGRLGIVDASECPPTYGVPHGLINGIIAGGDIAIRKAVEFAEDDMSQGWKDLQQHHVGEKDIVIGISASGRTPYVLGALNDCRKHGVSTGSIACNSNSETGQAADIAIDVVVGPEFVTGSTRMKAGTAQKLILNMITTAVMIRLGHVEGNRMVDMQLTNNKLVDRGTRIVMEKSGLSYEEAKRLLLLHGSVRKAVHALR